MISLPSLLAEVRACTLCAKHLPLGPRPVVQVHPRARVLMAGQAPGRRVHESSVPFDDAGEGESLTATVQGWRKHWPRIVPLPHPSPRNNLWLKRNPWFEQELLPALRMGVAEALADEA